MATILCIDHDEQYGRYVCTHLKGGGHTCIYAKSGEHALKLVEEHSVEMVICEVMLPDVCGFEISRRIRAHPYLYMLPLILMSTMSEEDEVRHGLAQGVDAFLAKPFDPRTLISCVSQKLAEAQAAKSLDTITELSSPKKVRADIQRAITLKKKFAAIYIEMTGAAVFAKAHGTQTRDKLLHHFARIVERCGEQAESAMFHAGHLGGGHYFCLIEPEKAESFCQMIQAQWDRYLDAHHREIESPARMQSPHEQALSNGNHNLALTICITDNTTPGKHAAQEYFDTLAQLRNKALASGHTGIFYDHRRGV